MEFRRSGFAQIEQRTFLHRECQDDTWPVAISHILSDCDFCAFDIRAQVQCVLPLTIETGRRAIGCAARQVNVGVIGPNDLHEPSGNFAQHAAHRGTNGKMGDERIGNSLIGVIGSCFFHFVNNR